MICGSEGIDATQEPLSYLLLEIYGKEGMGSLRPCPVQNLGEFRKPSSFSMK